MEFDLLNHKPIIKNGEDKMRLYKLNILTAFKKVSNVFKNHE